MSKSIFITNGEHEFNRMIAAAMLAAGHRVVLHANDVERASAYLASLEKEAGERLCVVGDDLTDEASYAAALETAVAAGGGLDALIHGNEMLDEHAWFEERPDELGAIVADAFQSIFLWNKAALSFMMKRKSGKIVFPVVFDTLYYDRYPSSPMLNHGKISLMKCLSRECSAFRIDVNVLTFGYHDANFEKDVKKEKQKGLELFGLKPVLKPLPDMAEALNFLIQSPSSLIGGQNLEIGVGIETNL